MKKLTYDLCFLFLAVLTISGCARVPIKTHLDLLFERSFKDVRVPEIDQIKNLAKANTFGLTSSFPHTTYDEVWNAALIVSMQQGVVVRASKSSGTMVIVPVRMLTPPFVLFLEGNGRVDLYLCWMDSLYTRVDKPDQLAFVFPDTIKNKMGTDYLDKLSTQVYSGKKWQYLNIAEKDSFAVPVSSPEVKDAVPSLELHLAPDSSKIITGGDISVIYFRSEFSKSMLAFRGIAGLNANMQGQFNKTYVEIENNDTFYIKTSAGILYRVKILQEGPDGVTLTFEKR
jgi:hypothetical protein